MNANRVVFRCLSQPFVVERPMFVVVKCMLPVHTFRRGYVTSGKLCSSRLSLLPYDVTMPYMPAACYCWAVDLLFCVLIVRFNVRLRMFLAGTNCYVFL